MAQGPRKLFYGWRIVGAAFGLQFMQAAFLHHAFGAYVAVLRESMGWSKTALSAAAAIQQLEGALLGPIQGWFLDRFGSRGMLRVGVVMFGLGMIMFSQVQSLGYFYASFVVIALGVSLAGHFPLNIAIVHWFEKRRARALSVITLGFATGGAVVPIIAWSLVAFGWRVTAFASGVIVLVVGWPLAGIIRDRPRDVGEVPDGELRDPQVEAAGEKAADTQGPEFTAIQAMRTPAFWLISLGHGFAMLVIGAINVHAITHMKEGLGYTVGQAALIISLQTGSQVIGILLGWMLGDRYEKRVIAACCMFAHMIGLLLLTYAVSMPMLIAFALLNGLAWGVRGPFMQAMRADYFGLKSIGMIIGISSIIVVLGNVGGPMYAGLAADATGDYKLGFTTLALLAGMGSVFFWFARRPHAPQ